MPKTAHRWWRDPWPSKLQTILDGLEIAELDDGARSFLQRHLYLANMFGTDGEGRVVMALRCISESEGNGCAALSDLTVRAISSVIGPYEDRGLALIEAFDKIPLLGVIEQMRSLEYFYVSEAPAAFERILKHKLRRLLPSQPKPPTKKELREQARQAKAAEEQAKHAAVRRIIEQKLELGRQLSELRDNTPRNTSFGHIVRHKFDLHHPNLVAEMIRVWKLYGNRPDITKKVRNWRVLAALTRTLLPEPARRKFEAKILAGENVTAKSIADKAAARKIRRPSRAAIKRAAGRYTHAHDRR
ncbi:hypothetical protein [Bradyrhizobium cenepequi]